MNPMTEEERQAAEAYLKLHDDIKQLIVDTIHKELMNPTGPLHTCISAALLTSYNFKENVKNVIKEQMNKY
jgi:hypothetical protein